MTTSYTTEPMVHIICRTIDMHTPRCKPCAAEHVPHATKRRRPRMTIPPLPPPPRDRRQRHRTHERAHGLTLNRRQFGGLLGAAGTAALSGCASQDSSTDLDTLQVWGGDRKSTRLNSSHVAISYAVFCLKK